MGLEAQCVGRFGGRKSQGKVLLESSYVLFRGDFRVKVEMGEIKTIEAQDGVLKIESPEGVLELELGNAAEKWKDKIKNPRSLLDKLGLKQGMDAAIVGITDPQFLMDAGSRAKISNLKTNTLLNMIFLQVDSVKDLKKVQAASKHLKSNGALWIIYPKGKKEITQQHVFNAGKSAGLVDVKIAAFSESYSALKFVIPVSQRK